LKTFCLTTVCLLSALLGSVAADAEPGRGMLIAQSHEQISQIEGVVLVDLFAEW
jgi:hypothetical protein